MSCSTGPVDQAVDELSSRYSDAIGWFCSKDTAQWKRTQKAMLCFKGLPLDNLPGRLRRQIDSCFGRINRITARYSIRDWDDYEQISAEDLSRIEQLITNLLPPEARTLRR